MTLSSKYHVFTSSMSGALWLCRQSSPTTRFCESFCRNKMVCLKLQQLVKIHRKALPCQYASDHSKHRILSFHLHFQPYGSKLAFIYRRWALSDAQPTTDSGFLLASITLLALPEGRDCLSQLRTCARH